ncbi:MAG: phospholipase D-like domain-containing protein [Elusimicrobiales bacterium]|jgi:phosphatidylserine/phosphatidylglycerophosphate/cardiolipin synthase-like enzyme
MNKILLIVILILQGPALRGAEIEFAESVPEETVYGSTLAARPAQMWLDMIAGAGKTLDFEEFYIADKPGAALEPVLAAVRAAAGRGVKVRFIVEKAMMKETSKVLPGLKGDKNIEVRVIEFGKIAGGIQHSKFFIVDGREIFVGSQNFDWRSLSQIHELGARVKSGRAARDFSLVFEADWALAGGADLKTVFPVKPDNPLNAGNQEAALVRGATVSYHLAFSPAGFLPGGFDVEIKELLRLIKGAKRSIHAQVMTYSLFPYGKKTRWEELDRALRAAGKRGVKVELIFADWSMGGKSDKDIKALARAENVSVKISSLAPHSSGPIPFARVEHCKYLVFDGERAMLSTSNWAPDYFTDTRGAALIVEGAAGASVLEDIFARSWNGPYVGPVDPALEYKPVKKG